MRLIVGLGNPGLRYRATKHNIGADVVAEVARFHGISLRRLRYRSRFGEGRIVGEEICIIVPETYMNLSGEAVNSIVTDRHIALEEILIVCDDADLPLGTIRMRAQGSDGGHKGLRSIVECLGSSAFPRLRIGIGKEGDLSQHVLAPFRKEELYRVREVKKTAQEAILCWLTEGIAKAMNRYNASRKQ